ncbi:MAG: YfhL family 4Fe-4S dicluster ferredoxin [Succinivibrionaceae bacterium]|nr:YfhL family 4Fe-4S dicluster ferredoxin [Succinivibrionaceae bacterium]
MAYQITSRCINCDMCVPECPNGAIAMGRLHYEIDPCLCAECLGFSDRPSCVAVCPVKCIKRIQEEHERPAGKNAGKKGARNADKNSG